MAVIVSARRDHQVSLAQARLPDDMRRHPGIARIGEVAVARAPNKAAVARGIEPPNRLAVRNDGCRWELRLIAAAPSAPAVTPVPPAITAVLVIAFLPLEVLASALLFVALIGGRLLGSGISLDALGRRWRHRVAR